MGWVEESGRIIREATLNDTKKEALVKEARGLGINVTDYMTQDWQGQPRLDMGQLETAIRVAKEKKNKGTEKGADDRPVPEDLPPEAEDEYKAAETDAERAGVVEKYMAPREPAYAGSDIEAEDEFALDFAQEVSPQRYKSWLMREDENSKPTSYGWNKRQLGSRPKGLGGTGMITPQKYVSRINSMKPDELEEFQRDLYAAGFYGSYQGNKDTEPMWGAPDEPTVAATKLLAHATMRFGGKYSIVEVLDLFRKQADKDGDGIPDSEEKEKRKPVITLTNQVDLADAAQNRAVDLMGRRLQGGEVGGAIGGYNQAEASYQTASQMAEIDNTGGTFTAPASPSAYSEAKIREEFAPEVDSYTYLGVVNALMQRLGLAG